MMIYFEVLLDDKYIISFFKKIWIRYKCHSKNHLLKNHSTPHEGFILIGLAECNMPLVLEYIFKFGLWHLQYRQRHSIIKCIININFMYTMSHYTPSCRNH